MQELDDTGLLRHLQGEDMPGASELADRLSMPVATVSRRLERLESSGVIKGHQALIDWRALGYAVEVSLRVTLDKTQPRAFDEFIEAARGIPEVIEIQTFLGQVDARLSVIARDMPHYQEIYRTQILTLPHIADIEALMVESMVADGTDREAAECLASGFGEDELRSFMESAALPEDQVDEEAAFEIIGKMFELAVECGLDFE